jgi:hypothetical protein
MLAANEHSLFKFEKDAEEDGTRDPKPWPIDHQDAIFCLKDLLESRNGSQIYLV